MKSVIIVALAMVLAMCPVMGGLAAGEAGAIEIDANVNIDVDVEGRASGVAWILDKYAAEDQKMPEAIIAKIHGLYTPQAIDCGDVQVTLWEVLYDGYWIYTAALMYPADPNKTLIIPGSAYREDLVSGMNGENVRTDNRSFIEAAREDGKTLLAVYVYTKAFDSEAFDFYFMNHRQDASDISLFVSGAPFAVPNTNNTYEFDWSIQIYEVNKDTGKYTLLEEKEIPATIKAIGDISTKIYRPKIAGEEKIIKSIGLTCTGLTTYGTFTWGSGGSESKYQAILLDDDNNPIARGISSDTGAFAIDVLPDELRVLVIDLQTGEEIEVIEFVADKV